MANKNIEVKLFQHLTKYEKDKLRKLTNRSHSSWFRRLLKHDVEKYLTDKSTYYIIFYKIRSEIIAWSVLRISEYKCSYSNIGIFVDPKYRRQGIGTDLLKKAKQISDIYDCIIKSYPWSKQGFYFFEKTKLTHNIYCGK